MPQVRGAEEGPLTFHGETLAQELCEHPSSPFSGGVIPRGMVCPVSQILTTTTKNKVDGERKVLTFRTGTTGYPYGLRITTSPHTQQKI